MTTSHGSHLLDDGERDFYRERFEQEYVRVSVVPPGFGNRAARRATARRLRGRKRR